MQGLGNAALISRVHGTAHGHTEIREGAAPIFVIGALNGCRKVAAGNLQQTDTSFNTIDNKVTAGFVELWIIDECGTGTS
jgi:hypothetical protein